MSIGKQILLRHLLQWYPHCNRHPLLTFLKNSLLISFIHKSLLHLRYWNMWRWNRTVMSLNFNVLVTECNLHSGKKSYNQCKISSSNMVVLPCICSAWVQRYRGFSMSLVLLAQSWISKIPIIPVHCTCKVLILVTVQHPPLLACCFLPGIPEGSEPGCKCRVLNGKWVYRYRILLVSCKQSQ